MSKRWVPTFVLITMMAAGFGTCRGGDTSNALSTAPAPAADRGRWAVLIGVDGYEDPSIPPCERSASDAIVLEKWLTSTAKWPADHILSLVDGGNRRHGEANGPNRRLHPTRENLDWAIKEWLASRIRPNDLVLIYFAGQAVLLPDRPTDPSASRSRDYLLPIDAREADLDRTGWSLDAALDSLAGRGRNPLICWLDTSTKGRGHGLASQSNVRSDPARLLRAVARWPGVTAWMAGSSTPILEAKRPGEPGAFLASALEASGTADRPSTLLHCLNLVRGDPELARQGFLAVGGIDPTLSLWPGDFQALTRPIGELVPQSGHADRVKSMVLCADGSWLATASMDSTVRVWSLHDRALLRVATGFTQGVRTLALSPDGRKVAAGDGFGQVKFWRRQDSEPIGRGGPPPHSGAVENLAFLPDSRSAISLDIQEGKALLWNLSAAEPTCQALLENPCVALACSPKRGLVVAALADASGKVHLLRPEGTVARVLNRKAESVVGLVFSKDGRELAVAEENGTVQRFDVSKGEPIGGPIAGDTRSNWLAYSNRGELFILRDRTLTAVMSGGKVVAPKRLSFSVAAVDVSSTGNRVAVADEAVGGSVHVFRIDATHGFIEESPLISRAPVVGEVTALAFSPDGQTLVAGEASGDIRTWSLPEGEPRFQVSANRRRIAHLAGSADNLRLLQISAPDGQAELWNLRERKIQTIPGRFSTGAFVDRSTLILTEAAELGGNLRLADSGQCVLLDLAFERPKSVDGTRPASTIFDKIAVNGEGTMVLAGSRIGQAPLIGFWDVRTGGLQGVLREEGLDLTSIALSGDGKKLLATIDRRVVIWELTAAPWSARKIKSIEIETLKPGVGDLTASTWLTEGSGRVALGTSLGRILVWNPAGNRVEGPPSAVLGGPVRTLVSTPGGAWLAAAGEDRALRVWKTTDLKGQALAFDAFPNHFERINTLVASADGKTLISGSDDTQVRFWNLSDRALLGSLNLVSTVSKTSEWVCATPSGLFDASMNGAELLRWTVGEQSISLEQIADKGYYVHDLTRSLSKGQAPGLPPRLDDSSPAVTLEWSKMGDAGERERWLIVSVGDAGLPDVRLYQDGVPIQTSADFQPTDDPRRWSTLVRLRTGENRFQALAGKPGAVDGRSETLVGSFKGPDSPPRLHIVAIGVSAYTRRALQYADDDALAMADFLHQRGLVLGGEPGLRIVLTDRAVEPKELDRRFRELRDVVKSRPQDTVVVFLAGHTDVLDKKFCLLLPDYPFLETDPLTVASRDGDGRAARNLQAVLPYGSIYTQLARLGALQRLVIVDACQAEAIRVDPQVELIRRYMATDSRKAKTAYLLAAREGEAATEVSELKHGLLSYVILRGLKATGVAVSKAEDPLRESDVPPDADLDKDGRITVVELQQYVARTLPVLAERYPSLVKRGPTAGPLTTESRKPDPTFRLQEAEADFPLVPLPKPR